MLENICKEVDSHPEIKLKLQQIKVKYKKKYILTAQGFLTLFHNLHVQGRVK